MCSYARHQRIHPGKITINIPNKEIALSITHYQQADTKLSGFNGSNLGEPLVYQLLYFSGKRVVLTVYTI